MRRRKNLGRIQLRSFEDEFECCRGRAETSYASQFPVYGAVVWDSSCFFFFNVAASGIDGCVGSGDAVNC